jgi:hypothetical protein
MLTALAMLAHARPRNARASHLQQYFVTYCPGFEATSAGRREHSVSALNQAVQYYVSQRFVCSFRAFSVDKVLAWSVLVLVIAVSVWPRSLPFLWNPGLLVKDTGPRTRIGNIITVVDSLG